MPKAYFTIYRATMQSHKLALRDLNNISHILFKMWSKQPQKCLNVLATSGLHCTYVISEGETCNSQINKAQPNNNTINLDKVNRETAIREAHEENTQWDLRKLQVLLRRSTYWFKAQK